MTHVSSVWSTLTVVGNSPLGEDNNDAELVSATVNLCPERKIKSASKKLAPPLPAFSKDPIPMGKMSNCYRKIGHVHLYSERCFMGLGG